MRSMLVFAAALIAAAVNASASGLGDPFAAVLGIPIGEEEAAALEGGDVYIRLNAERNKLVVHETPDLDPRTGYERVGTGKRYEIAAHNRVVDTNKADFMPVGAVPEAMRGKGKLTSTPEKFPAGSWNITAVKKRTDKFGPNMISTNAVGKVEVFDEKGASLGRAKDTGYAIHSNTNDFKSSKSWGCIIVKESDNRKLTASIKRDRKRDKNNRQCLTVAP